MAEAHNHHFVPQGYLRGFADGVGRKAKILAVDRVEKKSFRTLVRNVAAARDFNRIEAEGHDPNALEQAYAGFEGPAAEALRRIAEARSFADDADRLLVLNLVALLAARNPRNRGRMNKFMSDIFRAMAEMSVSTQDRWDAMRQQVESARKDGDPDLPEVSYEQMRDFVRSEDYDIIPDQTHQIGLELQSMDAVLRALLPRKWTLFIAGDDAGDFVTSDHPVCLVDVSGRPPSAIYGVGFGMTETAVMFPVSRKLFLSGRFEGDDVVRDAGSLLVARMNSEVIQQAERQVYAYDDTFRYMRPGGWEVGSNLANDPLFQRDDGDE